MGWLYHLLGLLPKVRVGEGVGDPEEVRPQGVPLAPPEHGRQHHERGRGRGGGRGVLQVRQQQLEGDLGIDETAQQLGGLQALHGKKEFPISQCSEPSDASSGRSCIRRPWAQMRRRHQRL